MTNSVTGIIHNGSSIYTEFLYKNFSHLVMSFPASILHKSISDRYRPDSNAVGPITVRYRLKQNASWVYSYTAPDRKAMQMNIFLVSSNKHMLQVLIRSTLLRHF